MNFANRIGESKRSSPVGAGVVDDADAGAFTAALVAHALPYVPGAIGDPTGTRASVKPPHPPHPHPLAPTASDQLSAMKL